MATSARAGGARPERGGATGPGHVQHGPEELGGAPLQAPLGLEQRLAGGVPVPRHQHHPPHHLRQHLGVRVLIHRSRVHHHLVVPPFQLVQEPAGLVGLEDFQQPLALFAGGEDIELSRPDVLEGTFQVAHAGQNVADPRAVGHVQPPVHARRSEVEIDQGDAAALGPACAGDGEPAGHRRCPLAVIRRTHQHGLRRARAGVEHRRPQPSEDRLGLSGKHRRGGQALAHAAPHLVRMIRRRYLGIEANTSTPTWRSTSSMPLREWS